MSERDMRKLQAMLEQRLGMSWADIVEWLREQNGVDQILARLNAGQSPLIGVDDAGEKLATDLHEAYVTAGQTQAEWLDRRVDDSLVRFDTATPQVVERQRTQQLANVQGLSDESRAVVQQALADAATTGVNPRETARRIRDSIGLTESQEQWVTNYREALEQQDWGKALGYELSSGRADASVRAAQRRGEALAQERIDQMVDEYRRNAITMRAETIARTESASAVAEGARDAMDQAIDRGDVEAGQLVTEWHAGPATENAREDHQAMDGVVVRYGEDFVLPDGTRMSGPHDERGGAEHNANCRCTSSTRMADIPAGFATDGYKLSMEPGPPKHDATEEHMLYTLRPSDLRGKVYALAGGGENEARMQRIRDAWANDVDLAPVDLSIDENGDFFVADGRHRLLVALEQGRPVLARLDGTSVPARELRAAVPLEKGLLRAA